MEANQTRFVECSDSDIKYLVANAVLESTIELLIFCYESEFQMTACQVLVQSEWK